MSNLPFDIDPVTEPEDLLEVARKELRETPETRAKAIEELRTLLHNATDLHYADDDEFLMIFLRPCKYYPESALKLMRQIAEFRKYYQDLLYNLMPQDVQSAYCDNNVVNVLTNKDQNGRRILLVNCGAIWDPKQVSADKMFQVFYLIHLIACLEKATQIAGVIVIMDFDGLSLKQVKALTPAFSKRLLTFIQDAMPLRLKQVHIVKQPFIFNMVWSLFKPFIREKLKSRMHFHGSDMKKLHQFVSPDFLPADYGGSLPKINYNGKDWWPAVKNYEDYIQKWGTYGFANTN